MIKVFTRTTCAYCSMVKKWLNSKGVQFEEVDVDKDPFVGKEIFDRIGRSIVPVVSINGELITGYNPKRLAELI